VAELHAQEKVHYATWASGIAALINLGLNFLLIPRIGISGAALASSVSYAFLSLVITWYYLRETHVPWTVLLPCQNDLLVYTALWHRVRSSLFPRMRRIQMQTAINEEQR
jgi:O-antigen/teichoic acid export membrane protein